MAKTADKFGMREDMWFESRERVECKMNMQYAERSLCTLQCTHNLLSRTTDSICAFLTYVVYDYAIDSAIILTRSLSTPVYD